MQQTMNDSTKFVDMLHNVSWEDGLPAEVLQGNQSQMNDLFEDYFFFKGGGGWGGDWCWGHLNKLWIKFGWCIH